MTNDFHEAYEAYVRAMRGSVALEVLANRGGGKTYQSKPEPKPQSTPVVREEFVQTIKNLFRMPIGNCGDISRHCICCKEPPTDFAVVYSSELRICYFFCNKHFIEYLNKPLPEDNDDRKPVRSNNSVAKPSGSGQPDNGGNDREDGAGCDVAGEQPVLQTVD